MSSFVRHLLVWAVLVPAPVQAAELLHVSCHVTHEFYSDCGIFDQIYQK